MGAPISKEEANKPTPLAESLGGRAMLPGENMAADQAEAARQQALASVEAAKQQAGASAMQVLSAHLADIKGVGSISQYAGAAQDALRTVSDRITNGPSGELPTFPGMVYVNHLFKHSHAAQKMKKQKDKSADDDINIYTDHAEALKTALQAIGVYSDRNPGGMPIDIKAARKLWFGGEKVDGIKEAEWRSLIETGDNNIDPKNIRKFVNYDGSMTWEILNHDKTVMSRFTMGEYGGTKVFTQGGYSKFADVLKAVKEKVGPGLADSFNKMQGMMGGSNG
jgi:hypothetical protein